MTLLDKRLAILFEWCALTAAGVSVPPTQQNPLFAGLGQAIRVSTDLLAALIIGGSLGWLSDTYLFHSKPWGVVVGLVLGLMAGIRNAYRTAQRWNQSTNDST
ncbi:MAG: ATP F0F1 synthase subunit I [Nitrospirae bacterium]|nr:MAG: ATP F0F1 synthase subunit I [Nitrospirota bacterium]